MTQYYDQELIISVICCIILLTLPVIFMKNNLVSPIIFKLFYPIFFLSGIVFLILYFVDKVSEEQRDIYLYFCVSLLTSGVLGGISIIFQKNQDISKKILE